MEKVGLLINNEEVFTDNYMEVRDPGDLSTVVGKVAQGNKDHVDQAVRGAHAAFLTWREKNVEERKALINEAMKVVQESSSKYKELLVREHGGALWEAETDFMLGAGTLQLYSNMDSTYFDSVHKEVEDGWIKIEKQPKGVVSAIVPWNMPIVLTMMKVGPALVSGNTIVIKPSPTASIALTKLLKDIASLLPKGVINVLHGDIDVGEAMSKHPLVRKVAFTGGTNTGSIVMANAGSSIRDVTLELGGNDPAIILDDVNPSDIIPKLLKGVFTRSGQICFAVKRVYVPRHMHDSFYEEVCKVVDQYKVGHGLKEEASFGPMNNKKQYDIVTKIIESTKNSNAEVRELGEKIDPENWDNGYYILPHVVKTDDYSLDVVTQEQFGPIIPIMPYDTVEDAIRLANDSEQGLCSSVWSNDIDYAYKVARRIEAGSTFINSHSFDSLALGMPFGGVKQSGIGRELAIDDTLKSYVETHSIRYIK
ncbi:aldehyde dehydrogenase family protein [Oceanobacillus rekensis]|uniref:aldehyde dehydrogenase family protein n=1 Tax=Oceanobacillus rekensis TaxID=937927 RepID=UPI000B4460AC|nr:aldehyde dehydrogenase family protein [Oceanobacillus rekensis]